MAVEKRRVGRPRKYAAGPGDYVGFRAPRDLKERLEVAANAAGRSLSTEAQFRIERSFDRQNLLGEALELAYGREAAALIMVIAREMVRAGRVSAAISRGPSFMDRWLDDPYAYDQATRAVGTILDAFRPAGNPDELTSSKMVGDPEAFSRRAAVNARITLDAIRDPAWREKNNNPELERFADRMREMLGQLVDRIPAAKKEPAAS